MRAILPLLLVFPLLAGCVDGTVRVRVLPDGSGSIDVDLGYDPAKWPAFLGDPYEGFLTREQLARFTDPGLVAWSTPRVVDGERSRRWQSEVFFDDIGEVRFLGRHEGQRIEALGFDERLDRGEVVLRAGFEVYLDDPLPLVPPEQAGMTGVRLSPDLLAAVRQRIRPVLAGFDVRLEVELPGTIVRADGLDEHQGRVATLHVDQDRLARAFERRAGQLLDTDDLRDGRLVWAWEVPADWDQPEAEDLRRRRAEALRWWAADR